MIIAISHMDGYYAEGTTDRDNPDSNALSIIVKGVDLMLDASNHETIAGLIFADLFKGSHGIDPEAEKLPGYVMGGVDLDYFNQVVIRCDNINDDYDYLLWRTANFPEDQETKKKFAKIAQKYFEESGLKQYEVTLNFSFNLRTYRNIKECVFTKLLFDVVKEKEPRLDLIIVCSGGIRSARKYAKGTSFTTYQLLMIFAFGYPVTTFEATKKDILTFDARYGNSKGVAGTYTQYYPIDWNSYKDDEKIVCGMQTYHWIKKLSDVTKKLGEVDLLAYMNNEKKLSHFAKQ